MFQRPVSIPTPPWLDMSEYCPFLNSRRQSPAPSWGLFLLTLESINGFHLKATTEPQSKTWIAQPARSKNQNSMLEYAGSMNWKIDKKIGQ